MEVLRQYPPSLAEVLRLDPSLLTSEQYIATYPGLAAFVARHPEVARNPAYFFGSEHVRSWEDYGPRAAAVRVWRKVINGAQISRSSRSSPAPSSGWSRCWWTTGAGCDSRRCRLKSTPNYSTDSRPTTICSATSSRQPARSSSSRPPSRSNLRRTPRSAGAPFGRIFWSVQAGAVLLLSGLGPAVCGPAPAVGRDRSAAVLDGHPRRRHRPGLPDFRGGLVLPFAAARPAAGLQCEARCPRAQ